MHENVSGLKRNLRLILIPLFTLSAFTILYMFRHIDDNRLTSWKWAFAYVDMVWFFPVLIMGLAVAYLVSLTGFDKNRPALVLFAASFMASAIFWNIPEVIVDTARYFTYAKQIELYGIRHFIIEWGKGISPWTDMPLVPLFYGMVFKIFGESRLFIQIFTTTLFSFTVVITYLIGKILWNEDTGFYAGILLLGIPYIYSQVPLMLVDVPTMFFLTLSIYTFIKAIRKGGVWIYLSSVSIFLAVFSKYSTWLMLSALCIVFLVYLIQGSGERPEIIIRGVSVAFVLAVLVGIVVFLKYDVIAGQISFLNEYQKPGLKRWSEGFISTSLYQVHPFISIAAIYSIYEAIRKKDPKFLIISWPVILIVVLQIKRSRYALIIFPMFTLMASYGLQLIKTGEYRRYIVTCIVISSVIVAVFAYMPLLKDMSLGNLKEAGKYLDSLDAQKVEIFTLASADSGVNIAVTIPVLDLFTEKEIYYNHDNSNAPSDEKIKESPLRFTWEYKVPGYYKSGLAGPEAGGAFVVISNSPVEELPGFVKARVAGLTERKIFNKSTGLFRFSPVVTIYYSEGRQLLKGADLTAGTAR